MTPIVGPDEAGIARAVRRLHDGDLVAFPTETVYGLGADARDPRAVAAIFARKGRPADHPLIVHVRGPDELADWFAPVPDGAMRLASAFWPGPLTLVGPRAPGVPDVVTGGHPTVAVRCPAHPVARALLAGFGRGVAAPSANRFGRLSPTTADHVAEEFGDALLILDGGACDVGLESTILALGDAGPVILRPGAITAEAIAEVLGRPVAVADVADAGAPRAPGRLESHYAPVAPVVPVAAAALAATIRPGDVALLREADAPSPDVPWLRLPAAAAGYGRELYAALRALDAGQPRRIVVETPPEGPEWRAVHDRLARASAPRPGGDEGERR